MKTIVTALLLVAPWATSAQTGVLPMTMSVSPTSGTGTTQQFTFTFRSYNGASAIQDAYMLFNTSINGANGCWVRYDQPSNGLTLENTSGTGVMGPLTPGSSGTMQNSLCRVDAGSSSVTSFENDLMVSVSITFLNGTGTPLNIYGLCYDSTGQHDPVWKTFGTWTPGSALSPPTVDSSTPDYGGGTTRTFSVRFSSAYGYSNLSKIQILFNTALVAQSGCWVHFDVVTNRFSLEDDNGTGLAGTTTAGSGSISNSNCTLDGSQSSANGSGKTLTVNVGIQFNPGLNTTYRHAVTLWGLSQDAAGANSGWQVLGNWSPASPNSLTPARGGGSQIFVASFDPLGKNIGSAQVSFANLCTITYAVSTNSFSMDGVSGQLQPGSNLTLGNSNCTLVGQGLGARSGSLGLELTLDVEFPPSSAAASVSAVTAQAFDKTATVISSPQSVGEWIPNGNTSPPGPISFMRSGSTITIQYASANDYRSITEAHLLINDTLSGVAGCWLRYYQVKNAVFLEDDSGNVPLGPVNASYSSSPALQNSQCRLLSSAVSTTLDDRSMLWTVSLQFAGSFVGAKNVYGLARDETTELSSFWRNLGSITLP